MNTLIEKRINFTEVIYDVYNAKNGYRTKTDLYFRKINMTVAKRLCRQKDDSFIPATVKINHFTKVFHMDIASFINNAKCVETIFTD